MKYIFSILITLLFQACSIGALTESDVVMANEPVAAETSAHSSSHLAHNVQNNGFDISEPGFTTASAKAKVNSNIQVAQVTQVQSFEEPIAVVESRANTNTGIHTQAQLGHMNQTPASSFKTFGSVDLPAHKLGDLFLQVGIFRSKVGAEQVRANTQAVVEDVKVSVYNNAEGEYRIIVGPIMPSQVARVKSQLNQAGLSYFRYLAP